LNLFVKDFFGGHLTLLKVNFCFEKVIGSGENITLLDEGKLDLGTSPFKITMQNNHAINLELLILCNHVM
jgi:hypothetical protein